MGGGKAQTVGFQYLMGLHMVICKGPIDALLEIGAGDRSAWKGTVTSSQYIFINAPELFGGTKREGGIQGYLSLMFGEDDQVKNPYLVAQLGTRQPAYRGVFGAVFQKGMVAAMNPYLKPWAWRIRRTKAGWEGGTAWYPTKAEVDVGDGIKCANVAHVIYEILTNSEDGMGYPAARIDDASFRAAADLYVAEGLGVWIKWMQSGSIEQMIADVIDHANCVVIEDPDTRLFRMIPMRDDYSVDTLLHFGPRTGPDATDPSIVYDVGCVLESFERTSPDEIVNEVTTKWKNSRDNQEASVTIQNPAALQAAGGIINQTKTYAGCPTAAIGARLCQRDLDILSTPLARIRLRCNRKAAKVYPGMVIKLSWPERGIKNLPVRVLRVTKGNIDGGEITIQGTEDVYKFGTATYVTPQASGWVAPDPTPKPAPNVDAFEIPFRDLVQVIGIDAAKAKDVNAGFAGMVSQKPTGSVSYGIQLFEKTGSAAYTDAGTGDFTPTGITVDPLPAEPGPSTMTLASTQGLEQLSVGEVGFLGSHPTAEAVLIKGINGAVLTIGRGCLDTTPKLWPAGTRFWGYDNYGAASQTEYATGEVVNLKALTNASGGTLDVSLAPGDSVTMAQRQARPYPPGNLKINGITYPAVVPTTLALTWSHRSRLLQADTVQDTTAGNIGPDAGTTYTVRTYLAGVLKSTTAGITGTSHTPANPGSGLVRVEIDAVVGGLASWQPLSAEFAFGAPQIKTSKVFFAAKYAGSFQIQTQYGQAPITFTAAGPLPTGVTLSSSGLLSFDGSSHITDATAVMFTAKDANNTTSDPTAISIGVTYPGAFGPRAKWRIVMTAGNGGVDYSIAELVFSPDAGNFDTTVGGTATANSEFNGSYVAAYAIDKNAGSRWAAKGTDPLPYWLRVDSLAAYPINRLALQAPNAPNPPTNMVKTFKVQSSADGTTWDDEWTIPDQTGWTLSEWRYFDRPNLKFSSPAVTFHKGAPGTYQLLLANATPPTSFSASGLPASVTMNSSGLASFDGTATPEQNASFTVTDATGVIVTKSLPIRFVAPYTARYWRIYATARGTGDNYMEIARFRLFNQGVQLDISGAIASDSTHYSARSAAKLIQNNECTNQEDTWTTATGASPPQWAAFDMGTSITADTAMMYGPDMWDSPAGRYPSAFKIQYSADNVIWNDAVSVTGASSPSSSQQFYPFV